jgi:hypothetical protein
MVSTPTLNVPTTMEEDKLSDFIPGSNDMSRQVMFSTFGVLPGVFC